MTNPLLHPSSLPYQLPPFAEIEVEHYRPAFDEALALHDAEISAITENPAAPTWENTVEALERSGQDLDRVMSVFGNLSGTDVTDEMEEIAADIYPRLSAHYDAMYQDEKLYQRIKDATPPAGDEEERACTNTCCAPLRAKERISMPPARPAYPISTSACPPYRRNSAAISWPPRASTPSSSRRKSSRACRRNASPRPRRMPRL